MKAADLQTPAVIRHACQIVGLEFLPPQLKRVDRVELDADTDPRVKETLGLDLDRPLVRLVGDTVNADGSPMGAVRGWATYVHADAELEVVA